MIQCFITFELIYIIARNNDKNNFNTLANTVNYKQETKVYLIRIHSYN
jgi:hypothetical protein